MHSLASRYGGTKDKNGWGGGGKEIERGGYRKASKERNQGTKRKLTYPGFIIVLHTLLTFPPHVILHHHMGMQWTRIDGPRRRGEREMTLPKMQQERDYRKACNQRNLGTEGKLSYHGFTIVLLYH